jgi:DNA-binding response OmpR family regulator
MSASANYHIILVDDELELGQICLEILSGEGYQVSLYETAEAVLSDHLNQKLNQVDFLITDVGLGNKSGVELASELTAQLVEFRQPSIPVLFISGAGSHKIIVPGIDSASLYYLEKPFNIAKFLQKIQNIFAEQSQKLKAG